jgi:multidrug efflux system outer membrane protein
MVGPKYSRPESVAEKSDGFVSVGKHDVDVNELADVDRWWLNFADPVTNRLVDDALSNNYGLKAAAARVLQAQANLDVAGGRRWPQVNYGIGRSRNKSSFNFGGGRFDNISTTFSQNISVSYVLDLWGKLKRTQRAAWAQMLASQSGQRAITNSLIASVIKARIDIAMRQRRLAIARANSVSQAETLKIVERRYGLGLVGPVDVRLARENLASAQSVEPAIELGLRKAHNALDVLLGRGPGKSEELTETLADLPDLQPIGIGIPASLLDRRPDVIAAELALRAANERVGVSIAQLYPDLTFTASYGRNADEWHDIWIDETEVYSAVFNLVQPIFTAGRIRAQIAGAQAKYEELAADYAGAILNAMREVEDALIGEVILQRQLEKVQHQFSQAKAAEELSHQRYRRGVENILTVLAAERRRRIAENELTFIKGQIWTTRVNLFLALGGDWANEETKKIKHDS